MMKFHRVFLNSLLANVFQNYVISQASQCTEAFILPSFLRNGVKRSWCRRMRHYDTPPDNLESEFYQAQMNGFFKNRVPFPFQRSLSIFQEGDNKRLNETTSDDLVTMITYAPSNPGFPRPLWLVLLASVSTGLLWYGYYIFAIEEELLHIEIDKGKPRGFGGHGTLGPFTYGLLLGPIAKLISFPGGYEWSIPSIMFLWHSQFLLHTRINDLYQEEGLQKPLQAWWCLPVFFPFNVIVALRQVHFLSQYFFRRRGMDTPPPDPVSEFFPFIKVESLTWQSFLLTPKLWCSLFSECDSIDPKLLPKKMRLIMGLP